MRLRYIPVLLALIANTAHAKERPLSINGECDLAGTSYIISDHNEVVPLSIELIVQPNTASITSAQVCSQNECQTVEISDAVQELYVTADKIIRLESKGERSCVLEQRLQVLQVAVSEPKECHLDPAAPNGIQCNYDRNFPESCGDPNFNIGTNLFS